MINDNDLLLLASSQNNKTFEVYIDSSGKKTLTPQTRNYTAIYSEPSASRLLKGKNPKKVIFPNCSEATGNGSSGAFERAFAYCTSLTSVSFPSLTNAKGKGMGAFKLAFENCTSLTSVSFPSLITATASGVGAFYGAFTRCISLTSVSFPSLTIVSESTNTIATFSHAFVNCSPSLKVHFKKSLKGTIGLDYITMSLTSADQVVFDLP